jgi:predicted permease
VLSDLKFAVRRLHGAPLFSLFAVASLALGVGVTTAAYSLIQAFMWPRLGITQPEGVVFVSQTTGGAPVWSGHLTPARFDELQRQQTGLVGLAASSTSYRYLADEAIAAAAYVEAVTGEYFRTLGVPAIRGRTLQPSDDDPAAAPVIVVSEQFWRVSLGSDPAVVGRVLRLGEIPVEIVGVAREGFGGLMTLERGRPRRTSVWIPYRVFALAPDAGTRVRVSAFGRLQPGRSIESVAAELGAVGSRVLSPQTDRRTWTTRTIPEIVQPARTRETPVGVAIVALVGLVLLVASSNLASLMLARGSARVTDMAVRRALGASRPRLIRELLGESVIVAVFGGAAALLVAQWTIGFIGHGISIQGTTLAEMLDLRLNVLVFSFAAAATLAAVCVFGLAPAVRLTRAERGNPLSRDMSTQSTRPWRGHRMLIGGQVTVSTLLFLVAAYCVTAVVRDSQGESGVDFEGLAVASIDLQGQLRDPARIDAAVQAIQAELTRDQTVGRAAVTTGLPSASAVLASLAPLDRPELLGADSVWLASTTPGLIEALGVSLLHGRGLDARDHAGAPPVAVVTASVARSLFGSTEVVGRQVLMRFTAATAGSNGEAVAVTIVGVARDTAVEWGRVDELVYVPLAQRPYAPSRIVARAAAGGDERTAEMAIRNAVRRANPDLAISSSGSAEEVLASERVALRTLSTAATGLGIVTLVLTMIGLYGVLAQSMVRRMRELSIRLALGATPRQLLRQILREGLMPVLAGVGVGVVLGLPARRYAHNALDEVWAIEPLLFVGVAILFVATGALACYAPARRASRVDPMSALKEL